MLPTSWGAQSLRFISVNFISIVKFIILIKYLFYGKGVTSLCSWILEIHEVE